MFLISYMGCLMFTGVQQSIEKSEAEKLVQAIQIQSPSFVHKGSILRVEVQAPPELTITLPKFETDTVGLIQTPIRVQYKNTILDIPFSYRVAEHRASPWLPLAEGNRWEFDKITSTTKTKGRLLLFIPIQTKDIQTESKALTLEIIKETKLESHYEFEARLSSHNREQNFRLAAFDGETYLWNEDTWKPFLVQSNDVTPEHLPTETLSCSIPALGLQDCLCYAKPEGETFAPAGPIYCSIETVQTKKADRVAQVFFGLISGGLFTTDGGEKRKTWLQQVFHRNAEPSSKESNPFWTHLHPQKKLSAGEWRQAFRTLSQKYTLEVEVAAALYQSTDDENNRESILRALRNAHGKERMRRLSQNPTERLQMDIALELTDEYPLSAYIFQHRADLKDPRSAEAMLRQSTFSLDPQKDKVLFSVLEEAELISLCDAMRNVVPEEQRQSWIDAYSDASDIVRLRLEKHLGLSKDPFLSEIIDEFHGHLRPKKFIPLLETALAKEEPTIEGTQFILQQFPFDSHRLKALELLAPRLPQENRASLLSCFTFSSGKAEAQRILGI
ncbi:MAG: DUF4476 domain-containing protein [Myxococcota bacterium]|nr:DUF4476 domain-containing protein [Myxococcota bacterium]